MDFNGWSVDFGVQRDTGTEKLPNNPLDLLEITAQAVGKHLEPCEIVRCEPSLDEALYQTVSRHAFPKSMSAAVFMKVFQNKIDFAEKAQSIVDGYRLKSIKQFGFLLVAQLANFKSENTKVCIEFAKQTITSVHCSRCRGLVTCEHAYATIMYRINFADKVKVYPPLTDALCSMSRNKLHKLVHKVASKDPSCLELIYTAIDEMKVEEEEREEEIHDPTVVSDSSTTDKMLEFALEKHYDDTKYLDIYVSVFFTGYNLGKQLLLDSHLRKAVDLGNGHPNTTLSLQYLHFLGKVAETYITDIAKKQKSETEGKLYLHDLMVNASAVFPQRMNPVNIDNIDIEKWKKFIQHCHKEYEASGISTNILKCSKWVELPRLYPLYKDNIEQVFGLTPDDVSKGYLGEALASLFIPVPPDELSLLFEWGIRGVRPIFSDYNEPLAVMMARANSYYYATPDAKNEERLLMENLLIIDRIIFKLAKMGLKYSVLSVLGKHVNTRDFVIFANAAFLQFVLHNSQDIKLTKKLSKPASSPADKPSPPGTNSTKENSDPSSTQGSTTGSSSLPGKRKSSLVLASTNTKKRRRSARLENALKESRNGSNSFVNESEDHNTVNESGSRSCIVNESEVNDLMNNTNITVNASGDGTSMPAGYIQPNQREVYPRLFTGDVFVSPDAIAPGEGLTKAQLAYSLIFWLRQRILLRKKYREQFKKLHKHVSHIEEIITGTQFLALELSRYRLTTKLKFLYTNEMSYLLSMEKDIIAEASGHWDSYNFEYIRWLYLSTWYQVGFDFYGDNIPVVLGRLVFLGQMPELHLKERIAYQNTRNPWDIFLLVLCDFMLLEKKDCYTFATRHSGPYRGLQIKKKPDLPTYVTYKRFLDCFLIHQEQNDVLLKMNQVAEECIHTQVKMFAFGMWKVLQKNDNNIGTNRGSMMMLNLTLHLCDLFPGLYTKEFSESIRVASSKIGINSLLVLKEKIGTRDWKAYVNWPDMEEILNSMAVRVTFQHTDIQLLTFYSFVLDVLQCKFNDPDQVENSCRLYSRRIAIEISLGVNAAGACADIVRFASKMLSLNKPACELSMKALSVVFNHLDILDVDYLDECVCRKMIGSVVCGGDFSDTQAVFLLNIVLDLYHCPTQVCYALLDKIQARPKEMQTEAFHRNLSTWLARNTNTELFDIFIRSSDDDDTLRSHVFPIVQEQYDLYSKHVQCDEKFKLDNFKQCVDDQDCFFSRSFQMKLDRMFEK